MAEQTSQRREPLRLSARESGDIAAFSSNLQDAIAPIVDMAYEPANDRFVMVVNRFKWDVGALESGMALDGFGTDEEDERPVGSQVFLRTNCGVRINAVQSVRRLGIDLADRGAILNLLAIRAEESTILLHFSGGACLSMAVDRIDCVLEDLGAPWLAYNMPDHGDDDADDDVSAAKRPRPETST